MSDIQAFAHFPCVIYTVEKPEFLEAVLAASNESLDARRRETLHEIYPVVMSDNLLDDKRLAAFTEFVGYSAWNILKEQGYAMQDKVVTFTEMWTQEHHKHSAMEQHIHGNGVQIVGFYFLETPENCSRVIFHDPRAGKVQIDLSEQDMSAATPASRMINFEPKPGLMMFSNAWLPHAFTRHAAETPIKFVHFNLTVQMAQQSTAEVI